VPIPRPSDSVAEPSVASVASTAPAGTETAWETGAAPRAGGGYRAALANPSFRRLWLAQLSAALGRAVAQVALPLLVYDLSGSARLLSLIFVLSLLPEVVLSPIAGLLADRLDRRRLMLVADVGRALTVSLLPLTDRPWQIAVLAALIASLTAVSRPAELAAVPMVAGPGLLVPSLSLVQVSSSVVRVAGPAAGAGIVGAFGPAPAFWLQTVCFAVSVACVWGLVLPKAARAATAFRAPGSGLAGWGVALGAARRDIWDGLRVLWVNPVVRGITAAEVLWQVVGAALTVGLVVYTQETLDLGDRAGVVFALLTATMSAGATLGALAGGPMERRVGRRRLLAVGYLGPLFLLPFGFNPPLWAAFACWFLLGFADAWAVIALQAYLAEAVPDSVRGRVYAGWSAAITLAGAAWYGVAGWAIPALGAPLAITLAGVIVGLGGPLVLLLTGALAALRRWSPAAPEPEAPPP
jgi:NRE family putative nickel resistance protein-like MFS transporter